MKTAVPDLGLVPARRGYALSVLDACVIALKAKRGQRVWPEYSFGEIEKAVSEILGRDVAGATIRAVVYKHSDLFERSTEGHTAKLCLSSKARKLLP